MKQIKYYLAIDIGASSGRHILGWLENGKIRIEEIYRFENGLIEKNGHLCWNIDRLFSEIINGLKTKSDGEFYQYAKVLDESDMATLTSVAKNFIEKDALEIQNGEFPMTSKIIDNKTNISCEYCKLKDICYHTNKQNVYLTSDKNFLKKEETKQ